MQIENHAFQTKMLWQFLVRVALQLYALVEAANGGLSTHGVVMYTTLVCLHCITMPILTSTMKLQEDLALVSLIDTVLYTLAGMCHDQSGVE